MPSRCGLSASSLGPNEATDYLSRSIVSHVASCRLNARHSGLGAEAPTVAKLTYSPECVEGEFYEVELPLYGGLRSSGYSTPPVPSWDGPPNRAVGMSHNRVRDATHQCSSHSPEPPTAHHDQARTYVLGNPYDLLGAVPFGYPKMLLGDLTSLLLDLRSLLLKDVPRLLPELFDH